MTIQYPKPLDKSRQVFIAMDNTSNKNYTIYNTILKKLRDNGITNLYTFDVGPNYLYGAMKTVYNKGLTNAIIVYVANGIDPTNIKELGLPDQGDGKEYGNDNRGRTTRARGNDAVIALFYDACDPTRPSGTCYKKIATRNPHNDITDGGYWPKNEKPIDYLKRNKIYMVNRSSNEHNKNNSSFDYDSIKDYTGEKIGQAIADLFVYGQPDENGGTPNANTTTTTPTVTPTVTPTTTADTTKVVATKTITQIYSHPHYERIYKLRTDPRGAFQILHQLPYKGEYQVTMKFGGDRTHNGTTRTIKVQNHAKNSQVFKESLLYTETTIKYTDNTTETTSKGAKPDTKHYKKVITTENYENGTIKNKTTKTIYGDDVLKEAEQQTEITPDITTPVVVPTTTTPAVDPTQIASPFTKQIPTLSNGKPNVALMAADGKQFAEVTNRTYTLNQTQYRAVFERDSKMLQLNNYHVPKYTAFESTDTNTWNVVQREVWNAVEESIMYHMVKSHGAAWPDTITVDFANHKTTLNGTVVNWKGATCQYHFVRDRQNYLTSCGDTSASVCSQILHNYISEQKIMGKVGGELGPDTIAKVLGWYNMKGQVVSGARSIALDWMKSRKPFIWHSDNHYFVMADINDAGTRILVANSAYGSTGIHGTQSDNWGLNTGWNGANDTSYNTGSYGYGAHVKVSCNWSISETQKTQLNNFFSSMGGAWTRDNTKKQAETLRSVS